MKYEISIRKCGGSNLTFDSNSRNAKKHLQNHGGYECQVHMKSSGAKVCEARYSPGFGYYYVV